MPSNSPFRRSSNIIINAPNDAAIAFGDPRQEMLSRIFKSHCLLDLRFADGAESYQTAIIELVPEQGYLVLDSLNPADGNALVEHTPEIHLKTRVEGLEVRFTTRITQTGYDGTLPYYKVPYPEEVDYPQRRREYRVTVPLSRGISMRIENDDGLRLGGEVRDLSPNGFAARLTRGDFAALEQAEGQCGRCEIYFPDAETLTATIEICHVFPSRGRSAPRVGTCFIDLDARTERMLERYVREFEREQARLR